MVFSLPLDFSLFSSGAPPLISVLCVETLKANPHFALNMYMHYGHAHISVHTTSGDASADMFQTCAQQSTMGTLDRSNSEMKKLLCLFVVGWTIWKSEKTKTLTPCLHCPCGSLCLTRATCGKTCFRIYTRKTPHRQLQTKVFVWHTNNKTILRMQYVCTYMDVDI